MKILIHGINFKPELTGIGKYTGEMAEWLVARGYEVRVVTAPPYYPQWRIAEGYANWWSKNLGQGDRQVQGEGGCLDVYRCPLWVPSRPSALKRLFHLASFALSSFPIMLRQIFWRPDVVMVIEPALFCAPQAWLVARLSGAKAWLHIQDYEVDAAFDLGLLKGAALRRLVLNCERWLMRRFDRVSTISDRMFNRLSSKGVAQEKCVLFPNWVDAKDIFPMERASSYRTVLGIGDDICVALYSGNLGEKQGLEILLEAARSLQSEAGLLFVICGEGPARERLAKMGEDLHNVRWLPLQPADKLNELLNLADVHLLPQRSDVADLVMPSKLLGMLASGRPVLATAHSGTQLAKVVSSCGKVAEPGNVQEVMHCLLELLHAPQLRIQLGTSALQVAQAWEKSKVLNDFEGQLFRLCNK
jgi:colanic acid biosynthesis glycosyl transferase WcaI